MSELKSLPLSEGTNEEETPSDRNCEAKGSSTTTIIPSAGGEESGASSSIFAAPDSSAIDTTTPGAVHVNPIENNSNSTQQSSENTETVLSSSHHEPQSSNSDAAVEVPVLTVEATAVQEIYATQVMRVDDNSNNDSTPANLQHVEIDGFDHAQEHAISEHRHSHHSAREAYDTPVSATGSHLGTMSWKQRLRHVGYIIVFVTIAYVILLAVAFWMTNDDNFEGINDKCILERIQALNYVEGATWALFCLSSSTIGVHLYVGLDAIQDRWCSALTGLPQDSNQRKFRALLFLWSLNVYGGLTAVGIVMTMNIYSLESINRGWNLQCSDLLVPEAVDEDLRLFTILLFASVPMIAFNIIGRGRLIFSPESCQHVRQAWKDFFLWLKILLDITFFGIIFHCQLDLLIPSIQKLGDWVIDSSMQLGY